MLIDINNFRTGKNKTAAKTNDVIPYQKVIIRFKKRDSGLQAKACCHGVPVKLWVIG